MQMIGTDKETKKRKKLLLSVSSCLMDWSRLMWVHTGPEP